MSTISVGAGVPDGPVLRLSEYGKIVEKRIREINCAYTHLQIDKYVIMPNHVHMLVHLNEERSVGTSRTPSPTNAEIPRLISTLKRFCNKDIGEDIWQRSFHDHIIRDDTDYLTRWRYIDENPAKWPEDEYYSAAPVGAGVPDGPQTAPVGAGVPDGPNIKKQ